MPPEPTASGAHRARNLYELYIMRHGVAAAGRTPEYPEDAKRPLTPVGKKKMQEISKGLKRLDVAVDWIVSSPLVRAVETAEIIAAALLAEGQLEQSETLSPGGSAEALIAHLAKHPHRRRVLVVGHEPDLSDLAARLMGAGRHVNLAFKKGGCCLIRFEEFPPRSPGQLTWWLTPRVLRKLA